MEQKAGSAEEEQSSEMQWAQLSPAGAVTPGSCTDWHQHGTNLLQVPGTPSEAGARRQHLSHENRLLKMSYH